MDSFENQERSPEVTLGMAEAVAMRQIKQRLVMQRIAEELYLDPAFIPEKDLAQEFRDEVIFFISQFDDPSQPIDTMRTLDAELARGEYGDLAEFYEEHDLTYNPQGGRHMLNDYAERYGEISGITPESLAAQFQERFQAIQQLADERSVNLIDVYADEDLYAEAVRRSTSLENEATGTIAMIEAFSLDTIVEILVRNFDNLMPTEFTEELTLEERIEVVTDFQLDEDWMADINESIETSKEFIRQVFMMNVIRTWGKHSLDRLTDDQKNILMPKMPLTTPVLETIEAS